MALNGEFNVIAHGCNCQGIMGAGIALQIAKKFPTVAAIDRNQITFKEQRLGRFTNATVTNNKGNFLMVFNLYTQYQPGANFNLAAFEVSMTNMLRALKSRKSITRTEAKIGIPMIGAGIGGGDWKVILKKLKQICELTEMNVTVVEYDGN